MTFRRENICCMDFLSYGHFTLECFTIGKFLCVTASVSLFFSVAARLDGYSDLQRFYSVWFAALTYSVKNIRQFDFFTTFFSNISLRTLLRERLKPNS